MGGASLGPGVLGASLSLCSPAILAMGVRGEGLWERLVLSLVWSEVLGDVVPLVVWVVRGSFRSWAPVGKWQK